MQKVGSSVQDKEKFVRFYVKGNIKWNIKNPVASTYCSCLENPRDRGAWWAAVYGVAQSRTRLKWLSSSSSSAYATINLSESVFVSVSVSVFLSVSPYIYMYISCCFSLVAEMYQTLWDTEDCRPPTRLLCPWDFACKNPGMGCHFLFQGICPTRKPHICMYIHTYIFPGSCQFYVKKLRLSLPICWKP